MLQCEMGFQSRRPRFATSKSRNPMPYSQVPSASSFPENSSESALDVLSSPNPVLCNALSPSIYRLYLSISASAWVSPFLLLSVLTFQQVIRIRVFMAKLLV